LDVLKNWFRIGLYKLSVLNDALEIEGLTAKITAETYIPNSSYFEWSDVSNYNENIREEFRPPFTELNGLIS